MSNTNIKRPNDGSLQPQEEVIEFVLDEKDRPTSSVFISERSADAPEEPTLQAQEDEEAVTIDASEEASSVFKELALPKLPALNRENRAWLQMQSPNKLYFYWSIRNNPFQRLNRALGTESSKYTFVLKLIDLKRDSEQYHAVEPEGNWWFNVEADSEYRAEIGFYSPSRPFVRVMYSNTVQTPRKSPSPRIATDTDWRIPAQKFAQVLDVAGFRQDAFDVAIAGDDPVQAEDATQRAFGRMTGNKGSSFDGIDADEMRYAMLSLAAGATLEQLRFRIGDRLFSLLQKMIDNVTKEDALAALKSEFEIDEEELMAEEEEFGPAVFGSSLVNFPRRTRLRTKPRGFERSAKFEPLGSHSVIAG